MFLFLKCMELGVDFVNYFFFFGGSFLCFKIINGFEKCCKSKEKFFCFCKFWGGCWLELCREFCFSFDGFYNNCEIFVYDLV